MERKVKERIVNAALASGCERWWSGRWGLTVGVGMWGIIEEELSLKFLDEGVEWS